MRAFVLSGGANRGSLQAGATLALLEAGIFPDLVVGSSVGAINSAVLASNPSLDGIRTIAERWKTVGAEEIFPGNGAVSLWRLLRGRGSFHDNRALRRFILSLLPPDVRRFGDLAMPLYVTATNYRTGELCLFGDDPDEYLIDPLMASCAVPPFLPAYPYRGEIYLDGGFVANLPLNTAAERGATEIWALEIGCDAAAAVPPVGVRGTLSRSFEALMRLQMAQERELLRLVRSSGVVVHHIQMLHYSGLEVRDFRHSAALMELGYRSAQAYLADRAALPAVAAPPEPPRGAQLAAIMRTIAATQSNLTRLRVEALRDIWPRRRPVTVPLHADE